MNDLLDNRDDLRIRSGDKISKRLKARGSISGKIAVPLSEKTTIYLSPKLTEEQRKYRIEMFKLHIAKNGG